jgi:hypothetical protein
VFIWFVGCCGAMCRVCVHMAHDGQHCLADCRLASVPSVLGRSRHVHGLELLLSQHRQCSSYISPGAGITLNWGSVVLSVSIVPLLGGMWGFPSCVACQPSGQELCYVVPADLHQPVAMSNHCWQLRPVCGCSVTVGLQLSCHSHVLGAADPLFCSQFSCMPVL